MDFILDLPIYESLIDEFIGMANFKQSCYELRQLEEMCTYPDELQQYYEETYLAEALQDNSQSFRKQVSSSFHRTAKTTGGIIKAYDTITTAKGDLLHTSFELIMKIAHGIIKLIGFIIKILAKIPKTIVLLIDKIAKIPGHIISKIRGDIELNITASDIELLYRASFIHKLKSFMADAKAFASGDSWKKGLIRGDEAKVRKLKAGYLELSNIKFNKSTIRMKDQGARETYLTSKKTIHFKDTKNQDFEGSYLEALNKLIEDLNTEKDNLTAIQSSLDDKNLKAMNDESYSKLPIEAREAINNGINYVSKVIAVIGNIMKYVTADIETINKAVKKIIDADNKKAQKAQNEQEPQTPPNMK